MTVTEVDDGPLLVHRHGRVVVLTLNDPPMNPVGRATVEAFEELLPAIGDDDGIRAVVIQGSGRAADFISICYKQTRSKE